MLKKVTKQYRFFSLSAYSRKFNGFCNALQLSDSTEHTTLKTTYHHCLQSTTEIFKQLKPWDTC